jgi:hypothetical protein
MVNIKIERNALWYLQGKISTWWNTKLF